MKYNKSMAETLAEMRKVKEQETDPVQKAQDKLDKARRIADLKKQIDDIKTEEDDIDEITMGALSLKKLPTLRGTITDKQLQNLKKVWTKKSKRDVTPSLKKMLKKLDAPTRAALANANINVISKLVSEEVTEIKEDGHVDVASAIRHCKTIIEDCNDIMSKLNSMGEQPLPSWLTDKITVAADDLNGARDYLMNPQTEEKEDDVNEATVTIKSYDTKTGLDRQAEKQMNAVATRAGAKVKKSGNNVYKVTGLSLIHI